MTTLDKKFSNFNIQAKTRRIFLVGLSKKKIIDMNLSKKYNYLNCQKSTFKKNLHKFTGNKFYYLNNIK